MVLMSQINEFGSKNQITAITASFSLILNSRWLAVVAIWGYYLKLVLAPISDLQLRKFLIGACLSHKNLSRSYWAAD